MQLNDYIESIGAPKFAQLLGVSVGQAYRYARLEEIPKPKLARAIKQMSHGLVDYADCYEPYFKANPDEARQLEFPID